MVGFGYKQAWLAIRDGQEASVVDALGLRDLGPVSWRDGIDLAYLTDDRVVLTPQLPGAGESRWLLVTGRWLFGPGAAVDVAELSSVLGTEVQFFATYRVGEAHRWERAVDGRLVRAFGYVGESGEVTDWRGEPDAAEAAIGIVRAPRDAETDILVSEDDVMRLAGAWSVDPSVLGAKPSPGPLRAAAAP
ncbi:hypothetical protein GCM10023322_20790 [Rugosimonospora acidiphila]|uniref:DUF4178 domain-containing protein n=2 Tax=Rugosimonospora acidiphila TaxID=556531 RepID=A0ABP9RPY2_9ACTN